MAESAFTFAKDRLMILFNSLCELKLDTELLFSVPLLADFPLFRARIEATGVHILDFAPFDRYQRRYRELTREMKASALRELPQYGAIRQIFYQSGILKPAGLSQLEAVLDQLRGQSVIRGGDLYLIALDTNLIRDRFYSVYLRHLSPHPNLDYVVCEIVRDELKNRKDKLQRSQFPNFKPLDPRVLESCFANQNRLADRLRYIGFLEYNRLRSETSCRELAGTASRSGTENDRQILKAYSDYVTVGRKVIFISRDNEAVRMMTGEENVIPILLEHQPFYFTEFTADWRAFFNFCYLLGILFGRIDLSANQTPIAGIYGVWTGKDLHEWEGDYLRISLADAREAKTGQKRFLSGRFESDLHALEVLESLTRSPQRRF